MSDGTPMLDFQDAEFAVLARDCLVAGRPFRFVVDGSVRRSLRSFIVSGKASDISRMAGKPELRDVFGVLIGAEVHGMDVSFEDGGSSTIVRVSSRLS